MKSHCKRGHERSPDNLDKTGHCLECKRDHQKKYTLAHADFIRKKQQEYSLENRESINQKSKDYRKQFPVIVENTKLKTRYGITIEDRERKLQEQDYKCAICGFEFDYLTKARKPYIDHSHLTNQVRGILCQGCNLALGGFKDSIESCLKAAEYLKLYEVK